MVLSLILRYSLMKSWLLYSILQLILFFTVPEVIAQKGKLPPFRMVQANGNVFKAENLPMEKPILIIYFSPECEECHSLTREILSHINELQKASVAMITYMPVETVRQYVIKNKLAVHNNIFVGTEGNFLFVKDYYEIEHFPFMALYNKNGDLIKKYSSKEINVVDMLLLLKSL